MPKLNKISQNEEAAYIITEGAPRAEKKMGKLTRSLRLTTTNMSEDTDTRLWTIEGWH